MERKDLNSAPDSTDSSAERETEALLARFRPVPPADGTEQRVLALAFGELARIEAESVTTRRQSAREIVYGLAAVAASLLIVLSVGLALDRHWQGELERLTAAAPPPPRPADVDNLVKVLRGVMTEEQAQVYVRMLQAVPRSRPDPTAFSQQRLLMRELLNGGG